MHVMRTTAIIACVFAKLKKFFNVNVPAFKISANRTFAFAALIHSHSSIRYHLEERHQR